MNRILCLVFSIVCLQFAHAELALVGKIVYDLDIGRMTATVLNFRTSKENPCDVIIPQTIKYKNEVYTVTKLSYRAKFGDDLNYDYAEARTNIEHIILPNTLKVITNNSFCGMIRLKELIIPASVEWLTDIVLVPDNCYPKSYKLLLVNYDSWSKSTGLFPRLTKIEVLGTPTCVYTEECNVYKPKKITPSEDDYVNKVAMVIAGIGTPYEKIICPNLTTFSMPEVERK